MKKLLILPLFLVLGGCGLSQQQQLSIAFNNCPALKQYSREQLLKAAGELRSLPTESQLSVMMSDYSKMRDACRLAQKKLENLKK